MPSAALALSLLRPTESTSAPGRYTAAPTLAATGAARSLTRSTARSVPGSRPINSAACFAPAPVVTTISSSCLIVCSAVTMMPGDQCTPLELKRGRAWTATIASAVRSVRPANCSENDAREEVDMHPACLTHPLAHIGRMGRYDPPVQAATVEENHDAN